MFVTLLLLAGSALAFRCLGALGVGRFASWRVSAAHGMAVMLVATAAAHFAPAGNGVMPGHADLTAMVPPFVPFPGAVVLLTGVLELLGAAGLVRTATRPAAGLGLAVLFVLLLPANVHAAAEGIPLGEDPAVPLWFRIPEQLLYIGVALSAATASGLVPFRLRRRPVEAGPGGGGRTALHR
ncbi:DoxX family protein [Streptomyces sp. PpalLS-921]|uniref:DoxX family protein n=1 Tax=Streptomyces sp. PpalLS-921 TaxID=1839772 RepID=UPI00081EFCE0|nr:hypothetical protein [Streptomyces sp. PpalLS-921]SCE31054.1 hypothetical protein GA0115249_117412 [Streptomyces sp. PpalLS-921]